MLGLLILTLIVTSIPMALGVTITALLPWIGELRTISPWLLLHFLWMYPVLWFAALITEPVVKYLFTTEFAGKVGEVINSVIAVALLAWMYTIFFRDQMGALLAALLSFFLMKPFVDWLERHTPDDDEPPEDGADSPEQAV